MIFKIKVLLKGLLNLLLECLRLAYTIFCFLGGRPTTGLQVGVLTGLVMGIAKLTEGYKEPYPDRLKYLREPPPKTYKLFDEEGNMITHTRL